MRTLVLTLSFVVGSASFAQSVASAPTSVASPSTQVVRLEVQGMVTDACPDLVRGALASVVGITHIDADVATKRVDVEYEPCHTSPDAIRAAIKGGAGFDTVMLPPAPTAPGTCSAE